MLRWNSEILVLAKKYSPFMRMFARSILREARGRYSQDAVKIASLPCNTTVASPVMVILFVRQITLHHCPLQFVERLPIHDSQTNEVSKAVFYEQLVRIESSSIPTLCQVK
jgi:hypothetical protein